MHQINHYNKATALGLPYAGISTVCIAISSWGLTSGLFSPVQASIQSGIRSAANYNTSSKTASYGICIEVRYLVRNGTPSFSIQRWSSNTISGIAGCECSRSVESVDS